MGEPILALFPSQYNIVATPLQLLSVFLQQVNILGGYLSLFWEDYTYTECYNDIEVRLRH